VRSALDIGTGCGIQAFHLAQHVENVVGTDISERCLEFARFNAVLNDIEVELRQGSLLSPVAGGPAGICIDRAGDIIVADWGNERVQILRADGTYVATLYGDATPSKWAQEFLEASPDIAEKRQLAPDLTREKHFWGAVSVRSDAAGRLYVAEHSRHRVQIYERLSNSI
jgi:SAM-dependent methyltransferase